MRQVRLNAPDGHDCAYYHCISRVVNREFVLGDEEREQFEEWIKSGVLECLDLAWSRETSGRKEYVQHRMRAQGAQIWKWLCDGAYFYVCGDKERMAKDVHAELISIVQTHGGKSPEEALAFVEEGLMKTEKRYRRDVY